MATIRRDQDGDRAAETPGFTLYVEGPRDRDILHGWARRFSRPAARSLSRLTVILGGRQPARAVEHFRRLRNTRDDAVALCVLDRDDHEIGAIPEVPGLRFFTWGRRHIESYLLVPAAIGRSMRLAADDARVEGFFRDELPGPNDEPALQSLDAKRLLARNGALAKLLGAPIVPGRVARAMQLAEFHPDILRLFNWLQKPLGIREQLPSVVRRMPRGGHRGPSNDILSPGGRERG